MSVFQSQNKAQIGVFGGSGFYNFLQDVEEVKVETPYGAPSDNFFIGKIGEQSVAFLPRHSRDHNIPPAQINYRANVWGMKQLGVQQVISPCAVGSLKKEIKPGTFLIMDQYVDRTKSRKDTFFEGSIATHVSAAEPYSDRLRNIAIQTANELSIPVAETGTVVVIEGPRFSTKAESQWFSQMGWDIINMTQYPEVHLVREMEMESLGIALVTDYDCGLVGDVPPVTHEEVIEVFQANLDNLRKFLFTLIENIPQEESLWAGKIIKSSRFL